MVSVSFLLLQALWPCVYSFYLPGVAPTDYKDGDQVPVLVNTLTSDKTILPYDFYNPEFHFCGAAEYHDKTVSESLGSILFGDRLHESSLNIKMNQNDNQCFKWCSSQIPGDDARGINDKIRKNYKINWVIDGLPAATSARDFRSAEGNSLYYSVGFNLGQIRDEQPYLNNVYNIKIQIHKRNKETSRVVGVLVTANSVDTADINQACNGFEARPLLQLKENESTEVTYFYSVIWEESKTTWGTRWDNYLHTFDPKIHWFSLINSIVIVVILMAMVAMILLRALHKDISRYNQIEASEDAQEDFGWKLVHADVFRSPRNYLLLSVLAGSGAQLFVMTLVTLVFAALGLLSPSLRGALSTGMLVAYIFFSSISGYVSARLYKMFGGENWKSCIAMSACLVPGLTFLIFIVLNFFLVGARSSGAVPFPTMFAVITLWFLISAPLCGFGAYMGFKKARIEHPVRTNQIPRQIPEQVFYLRMYPSILMGGILPFGAIFIELFFIMNSIWHSQLYYVFGFLFLVFVVLVLTCSGVTVLLCYFHLCSEDYHWWWRSYLTSGAASFYVFLYSILYYNTKLNIDTTASAVLYFGWSLTLSGLFFILSGTIGFLSCLYFVRKIYASIKID